MKLCPPPLASGLPFPIVRARPKGSLEVVLTCRQVVGVMTHWDSERTVLCTGEAGCPWCIGLQPRRWIGWISCSSQRTGEAGLLQFTPHIGNQFVKYSAERADFLGMKCKISRAGPKVNSRLSYQFQGWADKADEISFDRLLAIVSMLFPPQRVNGSH